LRIATILSLVATVAAIGGVAVASLIERDYRTLRESDLRVAQLEMQKTRLEELRYEIEQVLVSGDLYVGSSLSYLSPAVTRQIQHVATGITRMRAADTGGTSLVRYDDLDVALNSVATSIKAIRPAADATPAEISAYDLASRQLTDSLLALESSITAKLDSEVSILKAGERRNARLEISMLGAFLLMTVLAVMVTRRWITNPVSRLIVNAEKAMDLGHRFQPVKGGPMELRKLEDTIARFVAGLEDRVAERTRELRDQADALHSEVEVRRQTEQELRVATRAAEAASRAKSEFLSTMSHELRTPMNAVIGTLTLLQDSELNDQQRLYARTARESSHALMSLLNDVLNLSAIEAGKLTLEPVDFDPMEGIDEVLDLFHPTCSENGVVLAALVSPDLPPTINADPVRLKQVIMNLVGNAAKFTDKGHIYVTLDRVDDDRRGATLRIGVQDTGVGIDPDQLHAVFDEFMQLDGSHTRRHGGSGLGLAISRRLVELMGGTIGVSSKPGAGSEFFFDLPMTSNGPGSPEAMPKPQALMQTDVILTGPPSALASAVRKQLDGWVRSITRVKEPSQLAGMLTDQASNPGKRRVLVHALSKIDASWPSWHDVIDRGQSIPVRIGILQRVELKSQLGDADKLFDAIQDGALKPCSLIRQIAGDMPDSQGEKEDHPIRKGTGRILLVEDSAANRLVAKTILEHTGYEVDAVENGREAVQAFREKSYVLVLMDLQMPIMDGYDANVAIREISDEPTPIVALSANVLAKREAESRGINFEDYIAKPFDRDELIETVGNWIGTQDSHSVVVAFPRARI
jgi:signal transduction histidine kinase/CheY-like chemotaxis protein